MKKKMLTAALMTAVMIISLAVPAFAYEDSRLGKNLIGQIGSSSRTVTKGTEFELEVRTGRNVDDDDLYWSTSNSSVVKIDDDDRSDDEIELKAVGIGTAKISCKNKITGGKLTYTITVKQPRQTISQVGSSSRTVKVGDEFELEVRKNGGISDDKLYWSTSNSSVVKIDDDDRSDDEIELKAVGVGTAKISCKNNVTGGKLTYTITVKKASGTIFRKGSSTVYVELGDDEDIEVRKSGLTNSQIKWYAVNSSIVGFENGDNVGSEVEIYGKKIGTTQIYAKNLTTGGKLYYTVKVVPDDDYYDD